ncbi:YceI family protein [Streptomyces sp. NPDC023838]|uniref:YceI family protein n=1 Tax=Streptomyces sp. NPDC023838 TaxID=3154325 RepID=UPI0033FB7022
MDATDKPSAKAPTAPRLGRYAISTDRSSITFTSRHLFGLLPVRGTFTIGSGTVDVAEPLSESRMRVEVEAASFSTGNDRRDADVRSVKFLDTDQHPLITFVADRVDATSVSGTLTACGISRPASLSVVHAEIRTTSFTVRATTRVDRTAFGVTAARGLAGRYLDLALDVTCVLA